MKLHAVCISAQGGESLSACVRIFTRRTCNSVTAPNEDSEQTGRSKIAREQASVLTQEIDTCCFSTTLCASTFLASSIAALAKSGKAMQGLKKYAQTLLGAR
jgi:hypothetical protein